jgi:hypothetical protein
VSLDWKEPGTFDQWRDQFVNALGSAATCADSPTHIVDAADMIAQAAVELIQQRAKEAGR